MSSKKTGESSETNSSRQASESAAVLEDSFVKQPPNPSGAREESKYDIGRRRLQVLEDNGLIKQLAGSDDIAPTIIFTETPEEKTAAPEGGVGTSDA